MKVLLPLGLVLVLAAPVRDDTPRKGAPLDKAPPATTKDSKGKETAPAKPTSSETSDPKDPKAGSTSGSQGEKTPPKDPPKK
jgi:hypothetical protein